MVDYFYSTWRYTVVKLTSTYSGSVIAHLKTIFTWFGIPEVMVSDNGPQFASSETKTFAVSYNLEHITSSPGYLQGNDCLAERAVDADRQG